MTTTDEKAEPPALERLATTPTRLGHLAFQFRPGDRELAVRFFQLLGARICEFPNPGSTDPIYIAAMNSAEPDEPSDIIYLFALKPQQAALEGAIAEALGLGTDREHHAVAPFVKHRETWLESYLHFGLRFDSLEELEGAVERLRAEIAVNPEFGARVLDLRPLKARGEDRDTEIAERMAASPVFAEAGYAYGRNGVQVHIRTDLFVAGLGLFGSIVELDYVFTGPGRERNAFNSL